MSSYDGIYFLVAEIPTGKVATYGQIAQLIGQPRHARQVGYALAATPDDLRKARSEGERESRSQAGALLGEAGRGF